MPVIRRVSKLRRQSLETLTEGQYRHLTSGWKSNLGGAQAHFSTREDFDEAWSIHGPDILAHWIERCPGTRPLAWWLTDHGSEVPLNDDGLALPPSHVDGMRNDNRHCETFVFLHATDYQIDEATYLAAHGLLRPGDSDAIAKQVEAEAARDRLYYGNE